MSARRTASGCFWVAWAIGLSPFATGCLAQTAPTAQRKASKMADLALTLTFPQANVVSGENYPARILITNTGGGSGTAPADLGDDDYRFELRPVNGGEPIVLTRRALESAPRPGNPTERMVPQSRPLTKELSAGASRVAEVYPARLATRPIPAGVYEVRVSLISDPAVVSAPARLTVEAPNFVGLHATGGGPESGPELTWLHRDSAGTHYLFGGTGDAEAPSRLAGLRIAAVAGDPKGLQLAHAKQIDDGSGPLTVAWLSADGKFFAAVAQSAYVVARAGPMDLGLAEPRLAPTGWKAGDRSSAGSFAVLGKRGTDMELALVTLDRDNKWVPQVQRYTLALPANPKVWRVSRRPDGGHVLFAGYSQDAGSRVLKVQIGVNGAPQGNPVELMRSAQPLMALSAPLVATTTSVLQALTGPEAAAGRKDALAMTFHTVPIDGGAPRIHPFVVPADQGAQAGAWSMAEGAPPLGAIVGRHGASILGVRFKEPPQGARLADARPAAVSPMAIVIGVQAWAVWREGTASLESQPFPP